MNDLPTGLLFAAIALLLLFSAFFSSSETSMLSLNRYRLKHLRKQGHKAAARAEKMLARPDKLLGVILIGNNLVNILASSIATIIGIRLLGDPGVLVSAILLTLVVLIFAEITPKTIAALYPEKLAFPASAILKLLLKLLSPVVWAINLVTDGLLKAVRIDVNQVREDQLSSDELRTIVDDANALIPENHQRMLLNILDLESATVEDIMVPRGEIFGIDLDDDDAVLLEQLSQCEYTRLPVFRGDIDNIVGILHMRNIARCISQQELDKSVIENIMRAPVFTPEGTGLHKQLLDFQQQTRRMSIVVDEYGAVIGLVALEDILEEIVGEFTSNLDDEYAHFARLEDNSFVVAGSASVREINRFTRFQLPTDGPKTLNGLVLEQLESFPDANLTVEIGDYHIEILHIEDNIIESARLYKA
ncbi:MAG: HlyC/CorC family transporter [Pseudomonadales bacterium]|nr:HlyC/CorC family transporter [Pseudomonadales bacterium]